MKKGRKKFDYYIKNEMKLEVISEQLSNGTLHFKSFIYTNSRKVEFNFSKITYQMFDSIEDWIKTKYLGLTRIYNEFNKLKKDPNIPKIKKIILDNFPDALFKNGLMQYYTLNEIDLNYKMELTWPNMINVSEGFLIYYSRNEDKLTVRRRRLSESEHREPERKRIEKILDGFCIK